MEPLSGMSIAGEFNSKFDADLAVAMLADSGFEAIVMADPAHSIAPHLVTDHGFKVVVRQEVVEDARVVLEQTNDAEVEALDAAFFHRRLSDRPLWVRWSAWSVFWAVPGVFVIVGLVIVLFFLQNLFP